jgi:hypothetical protein
MRGVEINMAKYLAENETAVAVGNAGMNARGDMIDKSGRVIKSRAAIAQEYHAANPRAVKRVTSLKDLADRPAMTLEEVSAAMKAAKATPPKEAEAPTGTKKRKLSDS